MGIVALLNRAPVPRAVDRLKPWCMNVAVDRLKPWCMKVCVCVNDVIVNVCLCDF